MKRREQLLLETQKKERNTKVQRESYNQPILWKIIVHADRTISMPGTLTTSNGAPVDDDEHSLTVGPQGPVLIQDFHLIDKRNFSIESIFKIVANANLISL